MLNNLFGVLSKNMILLIEIEIEILHAKKCVKIDLMKITRIRNWSQIGLKNFASQVARARGSRCPMKKDQALWSISINTIRVN